MKLLSLGNFEKIIFLILLVYLVMAYLPKVLENYYIYKQENDSISLPLVIVNSFGFTILFCIPEFIIRKKNTGNENKENDDKKAKNIIFIYTDPKKLDLKGIALLIIIFIFYFSYIYGLNLYEAIYKDKSISLYGEITKPIEIVFLLVFSKFIDRAKFYRQQYIPILIMILMGVIRFIINIENSLPDLNFPKDLLFVLMIIFIPLIESVFFFIIKQYMKYKSYSPFFICFIMGVVFLVLSLILYLITSNIECGKSDICEAITKKTIISDNITILVILIDIILNGFYLFIQMVTINHFTLFHLLLFICFGNLVYNLIFFTEHEVLWQIIFIITFIIDILAMLVFVEIIILNCCGMNDNIKINMISKVGGEIDRILELSEVNEQEADK